MSLFPCLFVPGCLFVLVPTLPKDTCKYVTAFSTCTQNKLPNCLSAGLLTSTNTRPTVVIYRTQLHHGGLPPSTGNTTFLTIIDHFSKTAHFVALPKLPNALETAQLFTTHVFRLHGIPEDHNSPPGFGRSFALPFVQRSVFPLLSIYRAMDRQKAQCRCRPGETTGDTGQTLIPPPAIIRIRILY